MWVPSHSNHTGLFCKAPSGRAVARWATTGASSRSRLVSGNTLVLVVIDPLLPETTGMGTRHTAGRNLCELPHRRHRSWVGIQGTTDGPSLGPPRVSGSS